MTRVWSLATDDEPQECQLFFKWENNSKALSFDSGYESSLNSISTDVEEEVEEELEEVECSPRETEEQLTPFSLSNNRRVQSSPIPIPRKPKYKNISRNQSQNSPQQLSTSLGYSSLQCSSSWSLSSQTLNNDLIGHPPCNCGCIRRYRNPYLATNHLPNVSSSQLTANHSDRLNPSALSSSNDQTESSDIQSQRSPYPLPDIVSSSLSQNSAFLDVIIREIGSDLRRISKDFITTRNQKIESNRVSLITGLTGLAIPYILKELIHYFK